MYLDPLVKSHSHPSTNVVEQSFQPWIVGHTVYTNQAKMLLGQGDGLYSPCLENTITLSSSAAIEYALTHPNFSLEAPTISNIESWIRNTNLSPFILTLTVKQYMTYKSLL
jgi:hypothetical protein